MAALLKYHNRNVGCPTYIARSEFSKGLGKLCSAVHAQTGDEIIGGQMAAHLLCGGHIFNFSHQFATIAPMSGVGVLQEDEIQGNLLANGKFANGALDYFYRPRDLDNMDWWSFVSQTELVPKSAKKSKESKDNSDSDDERDIDSGHVHESASHLAMLPGHAKFDTCVLKRRTHDAVVRISGRRLANLQRLNVAESEVTPEIAVERETYAQFALVMFRPWRILDDLKSEDESWWNAFQRIERSLSPLSTQILQNMQAFYSAFAENVDELKGEEQIQSEGGVSGGDVIDLSESNLVLDDSLLQHSILKKLPQVELDKSALCPPRCTPIHPV